MTDLVKQIEEIFTPGGLLAGQLANYENRPGQLDMAIAVTHASEM